MDNFEKIYLETIINEGNYAFGDRNGNSYTMYTIYGSTKSITNDFTTWEKGGISTSKIFADVKAGGTPAQGVNVDQDLKNIFSWLLKHKDDSDFNTSLYNNAYQFQKFDPRTGTISYYGVPARLVGQVACAIYFAKRGLKADYAKSAQRSNDLGYTSKYEVGTKVELNIKAVGNPSLQFFQHITSGIDSFSGIDVNDPNLKVIVRCGAEINRQKPSDFANCPKENKFSNIGEVIKDGITLKVSGTVKYFNKFKSELTITKARIENIDFPTEDTLKPVAEDLKQDIENYAVYDSVTDFDNFDPSSLHSCFSDFLVKPMDPETRKDVIIKTLREAFNDSTISYESNDWLTGLEKRINSEKPFSITGEYLNMFFKEKTKEYDFKYVK